jgi:hypothetical protein
MLGVEVEEQNQHQGHLQQEEMVEVDQVLLDQHLMEHQEQLILEEVEVLLLEELVVRVEEYLDQEDRV